MNWISWTPYEFMIHKIHKIYIYRGYFWSFSFGRGYPYIVFSGYIITQKYANRSYIYIELGYSIFRAWWFFGYPHSSTIDIISTPRALWPPLHRILWYLITIAPLALNLNYSSSIPLSMTDADEALISKYWKNRVLEVVDSERASSRVEEGASAQILCTGRAGRLWGR